MKFYDCLARLLQYRNKSSIDCCMPQVYCGRCIRSLNDFVMSYTIISRETVLTVSKIKKTVLYQ